MDFNFWIMLLKIIIFLPFILILFYLSVKYGGSKLQQIQSGRYIKVLERVTISKENSIMVVKIGDKAFVLSSAAGKVEILIELDDDETKKIEVLRQNQIPQYASLKEFYQKVLKKKED
jgi:flagellar protein FliO/FliZ